MNNANNFDLSSDPFYDQYDYESAQPTGCFVFETYLSDQQAQDILGNNYDSSELYNFVVFDTDGDNGVSFGDDYFIEGFSDIYVASGSITFESQQAAQLGSGDGSNPALSLTIGLDIDGTVIGLASASPAFASRSRGRR